MTGDRRLRWRLSGWGVETTLETKQLGTGDDVGYLKVGYYRRRWRLAGWGLETTMKTDLLGTRHDAGD